jgi:hypothetical protein
VTISEIENRVKKVVEEFNVETFIFDLLEAYGKPKSSITRLQKGSLNLAKSHGEIIWKKQLYFRNLLDKDFKNDKTDIHLVADRLAKSDEVTKYGLRFVVVTDFKTFLAVDTKTQESLDIAVRDLGKHFDFFLPWSGQEKHRSTNENPADIKAAYQMARLYDEISRENPTPDDASRHALNVFLSRILFCFFAEDTEIFPKHGMFTDAIASHTQEDGSDVNLYLDRLFDALNQKSRSSFPAFIQAFPYVNGGLFGDKLKSPKFGRKARKILIECGALDWSEINPDIFGSMIQAVVHPSQRSETGMHYTSVPNIMKVIEPLFLANLRDEFEDNLDSVKGLERLRNRLKNIRVFDPACGSGNFLIIAFKELRKLEMEIVQRLRELNVNYQTMLTTPEIQLTQFFGIELDDFAHEIAILSMWLAEHQMNVKFKEKLGVSFAPLPLKPSGKIVCGNATSVDWEKVCPKSEDSQIFILGNPPYLGARYQDAQQKADMALVFKGIPSYKNLDYISCWFFKAAKFIAQTDHQFAFVTTNSLCQGEQVELIWPLLLAENLEIGFAHRSFKWQNSAKHNAGVTVIVIGLRAISKKNKLLYSDSLVQEVENINPYLTNARNIIVGKRSSVLALLPEMDSGNKATDGGFLMLSPQEKQELVKSCPEARKVVKKVFGANEFIKGIERWCLWIEDKDASWAAEQPFIKKRLDGVKKYRLSSPKEATKKLAALPYKFDEVRHQWTSSLIIPTVSSETRTYIPVGFLGKDDIIIAPNQVIYAPEIWVMGVLSSRMHNVWVRTVAGRLEERIRYSSVLCYNTFPLPELTDKQKETLTTHSINILSEREKHAEKTIAQMYDLGKMPAGLQKAHFDLDTAIEKCYRSKPFTSDEERLEYLFGKYEELSAGAKKGKSYA